MIAAMSVFKSLRQLSLRLGTLFIHNKDIDVHLARKHSL